ncbi:MAG: anti-sigma factor [Saprospiraceae bacterium]|nr:anti-sigma factor [Saprospiraceae bacterium]
MDKQELIESGLLELYATGAISADESDAVAHLLGEVDVKAALENIELSLEHAGFENAVSPPSWVLENITKEIAPSDTSDKGHSISLVERQLEKWRRNFMVAASIAGLLALGLGWQFTQKGSTGDTNSSVLTARVESLEQELEKLRTSNSSINDQLAYINHTYTTPLVLKSTPVAPGSKAVVYWNPKTPEALLSTNGLPELPDGKVYQIWADIEGEMVSMKVFTMDQKLVPLPYMPKAESLNITVEPEGGSDHPNVEQLYVNGATTV